jgi:hypothetical protein
VAQQGWDAGCREHCVWGYFADHYKPPESARNRQIADIAPTAIDARMIVRLESCSGFIAWLLKGWFDIGHDDKLIGAPVLNFDGVELVVNLTVYVGKNDFFDFFFGKYDFHDAPWLGPKPRG